MNPVQTGKFTVAVMCWSCTLKLCQPADSHWLDNVSSLSPSFLPPFSLVHHLSLPLSCHQSHFGFHSLILPIPVSNCSTPVFLFCISQQSPGQASALNSSTGPCPACLSVYLSVYLSACLHLELLPCTDWRHTGNEDVEKVISPAPENVCEQSQIPCINITFQASTFNIIIIM